LEPVPRDVRTRSLAGEVFIAVVLIGVLYFARQIIEPIALAILLSFVLSPAVVRLRRLGLPQVPSVMVVVILTFILLGGVAAVIGSQLTQLAGDLPKYQTTLEEKANTLRSAVASGSFRKIGEFLSGLNKEMSKPPPAPPETTHGPAPSLTAGATPPAPAPVPVVVQQPEPPTIQVITNVLTPLLEPLAMIGIVAIFVIFILLQRQDLRDRLIWLAGSRDLRRATVAIDDAVERLSRYFLAQTAINLSFGVIIGSGLWLIGIPNPVLWGVLAALLRFVPYVGTIIATALPLALAAAVDPGWSKALWGLGLFMVVELTLSQAVEPVVYGRSTGLSPIAVITAAAFWTWLWGPIGLLLSTPLTLLIVVLGQHVDQLAFLAILLGDTPALSPAERFFQRVTSGNADEAAEQGERFLKEQQALAMFYDEIALQGLRLAQIEANRGTMDLESLREMAATVEEVVENFAPQEAKPPADRPAVEAAGAAEPQPAAEARGDIKPEWQVETPVLCIAGRSPLDEAVAAMFRQLMANDGFGVRIASYGAASSARIFKLDTEGAAMMCLSYLAVDGSPTHTRFLIRRLRRRAPGIKILACFWTYEEALGGGSLEELRSETGADFVATTLQDAVAICTREARQGALETDAALPDRPREIA
jgi:predicted PurR-regulated permease PerM